LSKYGTQDSQLSGMNTEPHENDRLTAKIHKYFTLFDIVITNLG